nr:hypothetical protein [Candidatus Sigynarchaeum springense]
MITKEERLGLYAIIFADIAAKQAEGKHVDDQLQKHLLRLVNNIGFFPTDLRRVEGTIVLGGPVEEKKPEVSFPHAAKLDLIWFIDELFEVIEAADKKDKVKTIELIERFLSTAWAYRILDYNPLYEIYADALDAGAILQSMANNTVDFGAIYDWKTNFRSLFDKDQLYRELSAFEGRRKEAIKTASKMMRSFKHVHGKIHEGYEAFSIIVGFLLGLGDIAYRNPLRDLGAYLGKEYNTSEGIVNFDNSTRRPSVPLHKDLKLHKHSHVDYFFTKILHGYYRPIRNGSGHLKDEQPFRPGEGTYHIVYRDWFNETFTIDELEQALMSLYFMFKLTFAIAFQFLRFPERAAAIKSMAVLPDMTDPVLDNESRG